MNRVATSIAWMLIVALAHQSQALTEEEANQAQVLPNGILDTVVPEKAEIYRFSRAASESDYQVHEPGQIRYVSGPPARQHAVSNYNDEAVQLSGHRSEAADAEASRRASAASESSSSDDRSSSLSSLSSQKSTTTTTTTTTVHQPQPVLTQIARIQEYKVHAIPGSVTPIHYTHSYVVVPPTEQSSSSGSLKSAKLEKEVSQSSSSSSRTEETEVVETKPSVTVVNSPPILPVGPNCVLHRLIVERPVVSPESVVTYQTARLVEPAIEPPAVVPPVCCFVKKQTVAKIVASPPPAPASHNLKEEHHHEESRSFREESSGTGHSLSSSSSSSSSLSSSKSSQTSSSTVVEAPTVTTVVQTPAVTTARLIAAPAPTLVTMTKTSTVPVTVHHPSGNKYSSVDVNHQYADPNVRYGYTIKQSSSEPSAEICTCTKQPVQKRVRFLCNTRLDDIAEPTRIRPGRCSSIRCL
ncbi:hypothetical protein GZH46_01163, partial [Fragariocoptes setiger]